ncbi:MAG: NYN domain-containing protein, partial [Shewanella sp.]
VILLSGDGDFDLLLKKVHQQHGTETQVYGVAPLTAKSLQDAAQLFHPIDARLLR